jgi:hypothetical protein
MTHPEQVASKKPRFRGFFFGAPSRAHVLGGESRLHTRQGEVLAERQGCRGNPVPYPIEAPKPGANLMPLAFLPATVSCSREVY